MESENRLLARWRENFRETCLHELSNVEDELARREQLRPRTLIPEKTVHNKNLSADLGKVRSAPTITDRDRKELLHTLL